MSLFRKIITTQADVTGDLLVKDSGKNFDLFKVDSGANKLVVQSANGVESFSVSKSGDTEIKGDLIVKDSTEAFDLFKIDTSTNGNLDRLVIRSDVNTESFSVAKSGNTAIAGTLGVTGASTLSSTLDVALDSTLKGNLYVKDSSNATKFSVAPSSGNTEIKGDLLVKDSTEAFDLFKIDTSTNGNLDRLVIRSDVNTESFSVAKSGNTAIAGNLAIATDKFTVASASGDTAIAGNLAIASTKFTVAAASGDTYIEGDAVINGNLQVKGVTTSIDSTDVNIGDAHLYLNAVNTSAEYKSGGLVINYQALHTHTVAAESGLIAGRTIAVDDETKFPVHCFVQISGSIAENNGIYEVDSVDTSSKSITLKSSGTKDFSKTTALEASSGSCSVSRVKVSHLRVDANGKFEIASGELATAFEYEKIDASNYHIWDISSADKQMKVGTNVITVGEEKKDESDLPLGYATYEITLPDNTSGAYNGKEFKIVNKLGYTVHLDASINGVALNDFDIEGGYSICLTGVQGEWHII